MHSPGELKRGDGLDLDLNQTFPHYFIKRVSCIMKVVVLYLLDAFTFIVFYFYFQVRARYFMLIMFM